MEGERERGASGGGAPSRMGRCGGAGGAFSMGVRWVRALSLIGGAMGGEGGAVRAL